MYLSRCRLDPARRGAHKLLGSPQAMHAAVMAAVPPSSPTDQGRVLWRVDLLPHVTWLYVLSSAQPDLAGVIEQAGWLGGGHVWDSRPYDGLLSSLASGQEYAFRLTANPTRSTRLEGKDRSQRYGHVTAAQQLTWLLDRAPRVGIAIARSEMGPQAMVVARQVRRFRRADAWITLTTVTYEGRLRVDDPEALRPALVSGVGPAKAYGCGLLTLAPVPTGEST